MKYLQHVFRLCLLLAFALATQVNVQASHLAGADLTYRWISGMDYEVTVVWYEDVAGSGTLATVLSMDIDVEGCGSSQRVVAPRTSIAPVLNCGIGTTYDKYTYKARVRLSGPCANWVFRTSYCCRNAIITTIGPLPDAKSICVSATLNNFDFPGNNSPTFGDDPIFFLCVCQPYTIDHAVAEPDGDVLSFTNVLPRGNGTNCADINYTGIYAVNPPLGTALTLNTSTGLMTGTTSCTGPLVTVMATQVTERRGGIIIGTVTRDIQIQVGICANNPPTLLAGIMPLTICVGEAFSMSFSGGDPDGDNVTISWGNELAGALLGITGNGTTSPSGGLNWTPSSAGSYTFTITVTDDGCPEISQTYTYTIEVVCCLDLHIASCCEESPNVTCDPCIDGWRTVWIEDADGNPIGDPFGDSCWVVTWTDDQGNTYTGFSIPAYNDVAYTVSVIDTCTGCSWQESFMDSCCMTEVPVNLECDSLRLFWDAVSGATGYQVDITFNDPDCCPSGGPLPTGMLYNVTLNEFDLSVFTTLPECFSWRVRAQCSQGQYGPWSDKVCFTCGDSCTTTAPTGLHCTAGMLHWDIVAGASQYAVRIVYNDPHCCAVGGAVTTVTYFTPINELDLSAITLLSDCFSWEVRALCGSSSIATWGPWSGPICYACGCELTVPTGLHCTAGKLHWDAIVGAGMYQVRIVFNDPHCCLGGTVTTVSHFAMTNEFDLSTIVMASNCFSWEVRALCGTSAATGVWGLWSGPICYTCDCSVATPTNLHCAGTKLHWDVVFGASGYQVEIIFNDPLCCPPTRPPSLPSSMIYNVLTNEFDFSVLGANAGCFSWKVRARCSANTFGPWTSNTCLRCTTAGGSGSGSNAPSSGNLGGGLKVYPNPASDLLHISGPEVKGGSSIQVTDISGRVVKTIEVKEDGDQSFSTSELSDGMYLLQLIDAKGKALEVKKVSIKH